ncbi:hypothetical protein PR048_023290, partial [Dryococelus australis]
MLQMFTDFYKWQREDDGRSNISTYRMVKDLIFQVYRFKKNKLFVPIKVRDLVLKYFHSSTSWGHMGKKKTRTLIMRKSFWPGMGRDIDTFVFLVHCQDPEFWFAFNSVPHSATGFSPYKIFLGRELPVPLLNAIAKRYNSDRLENNFQESELVLCRRYVQSEKVDYFSTKLVMPFHGPFYILRFLGHVT